MIILSSIRARTCARRGRLSDSAALAALAVCAGFGGAASAQAPYAADPDQHDHSAPEAEGRGAVALGPAAVAEGDSAQAFGGGAQALGDWTTAVGTWAWAHGEMATALGYASFADPLSTALGGYASAWGEQSLAVGWNAATWADYAIAMGATASAEGVQSIAIGEAAWVYSDSGAANVDGGIAIGGDTTVWGENGIAIGRSAQAFEPFSIAMGGNVLSEGFGAIGVGEGVIVYGDHSLAMGYGLQVQGERSIALGSAAMVMGMPFGGVIGDDGVGLGVGALVIANNAVALGAGSMAHEDDTVSVGFDVAHDPLMGFGGRTSFTRRIVNVSDGVIAEDSTDAVTGGQLHTVVTEVTANTTAIAGLDGRLGDAEAELVILKQDIDGAGPGLVLQDSSTLALTVAAATGGDVVSFAGTDGARRLTGVAAAAIAADGDAAVTTGQLFATHQALAGALGGGAAFDVSGAFTAPSYAVLGSVYDNVGGALGALDTQVSANTADIDTLRTNGSGGGSGGDDARDQEIAALRAQIQAMSAVLDRLEAGAISGGEATGPGTTAAGEGAVAEQYGDTAYGAGARATGDPSTAIGFAALASGQHSTAIGGGAEATGDLSSALGQGAVASGANSLALGQGAQAAHADSIAIGQGVTTSRAGQVAIGSSSSTYTLAGLHSDASRAAQSGPTYMVTTDAAGNLGTMDMSAWFLQVDSLETRMDLNDARWRVAERTLDRHADGVAMAIALGAQVLQPGQAFAMSGNLGVFDGNGAVGFGAIGRVNHNVTLNIGVGTGFRTGVASGRVGVSIGW